MTPVSHHLRILAALARAAIENDPAKYPTQLAEVTGPRMGPRLLVLADADAYVAVDFHGPYTAQELRSWGIVSSQSERAQLLALHANDPDKCPIPECLCHLRKDAEA